MTTESIGNDLPDGVTVTVIRSVKRKGIRLTGNDGRTACRIGKSNVVRRTGLMMHGQVPA